MDKPVSKIKIRIADTSDTNFIQSIVPRLIEFGPPAWRDADQMIATDRAVLNNSLTPGNQERVIYIAEDENNNQLGFIHVHAGEDYYNKEKHGHIADVIVAPGAAGLGVGKLLLGKAEDWARTNGFRWLTLSVFSENVKARNLYKTLGYGEDMVKYVKEIN
ncbi:MAG: GNAT family N-acetyltransferase [Rhizobacter sp.]|nr:GNAT family N-acetyltransferase [Ferruginibacter sp.]